jgi:hypothetical protein
MGGNGLCVDSRMNATPAPNQFSFMNKRFLERAQVQGGTVGGVPDTPTQEWKIRPGGFYLAEK